MNQPDLGLGFTLRDLINEATREIELRERVYPKWIELKRLSPKKAALHLALMRAIKAKLEQCAANEDDRR